MRTLNMLLVLVLAVSSVAAQDTDANKAVVEKWVEAVWHKHDRSHISNNATANFPVDNYTAFYDSILTYYPDARVDIIKMVAEGDNVVIHWNFKGTSADTDTEGKQIENAGMTMIEVKDGKINSALGFYDDLANHRQLGFTLRPPEEKKVQQVILDYHEGIQNKDPDIHSKIFDETYLTLARNDSTDEWSSNYRDHMHTDSPVGWFQDTEYESRVEFVSTRVNGDNATVDVRETGRWKNTETGESGSWEDARNVWILHKNANGNWKIVGVLFVGG